MGEEPKEIPNDKDYEQYSKFELFMMGKMFQAREAALMDVIRFLTSSSEDAIYKIEMPKP